MEAGDRALDFVMRNLGRVFRQSDSLTDERTAGEHRTIQLPMASGDLTLFSAFPAISTNFTHYLQLHALRIRVERAKDLMGLKYERVEASRAREEAPLRYRAIPC